MGVGGPSPTTKTINFSVKTEFCWKKFIRAYYGFSPRGWIEAIAAKN
jgi:hypothetical protein